MLQKIIVQCALSAAACGFGYLMYKGMRNGTGFGEQNVNVTNELEAAELELEVAELKTEVAELKVGVAVSAVAVAAVAVAVVLVVTEASSAFSESSRTPRVALFIMRPEAI